MVTHEPKYESLIIRFLNGEASPEEAMLLEDWKEVSSENQKLFEQYEQLLSKGKNFRKPATQEVWTKIRPEQSETARIVPLQKWSKWIGAAAAVLIMGMLLYTNFSTNKKIEPIAANPSKVVHEPTLFAKNGAKEFTLKDQSKVELTQGSSLQLSDDFNQGERRATLKGSGRFTVVHDVKNPFVIDVEGLEVFDIGTVFDIQTDEDTVKVIVYEGAVELRLNQEVLALAAGDSAFYVISERLIDEYPTAKERKDTIFHFDGTSLKEVAMVLEKFFDRPIIIMNPEIEACPLTVRFKNKSLAEILDVIEIMLDLKIVSSPSKIEIYGEGC